MNRVSLRSAACVGAAMMVVGCAETQLVVHSAKELVKTQTVRPVSKTKGTYKIGKPYRIENTWYYPAENFKYSETGISSWYGPKFHGKKTANGEIFDMNTLTAAHRTLPMPSAVRVLNMQNGRSLILRVNDRGPFARGRIIDVSRRSAQLLGFQTAGTARVRVEIIADESQRLKLAALNQNIPESERLIARATNRRKVERQSLIPLQSSPQGTLSSKTSAPHSNPKAQPDALVEVRYKVQKNKLFVQAGAYVGFASASKVRTQLSRYGAAWLSETTMGRQKFYRVRVGPMRNVTDADLILSKIIAAGFPKARIVVE